MKQTSFVQAFGCICTSAYFFIGYALSRHVPVVDAIAITLAFATLVGAIRTKVPLEALTTSEQTSEEGATKR